MPDQNLRLASFLNFEPKGNHSITLKFEVVNQYRLRVYLLIKDRTTDRVVERLGFGFWSRKDAEKILTSPCLQYLRNAVYGDGGILPEDLKEGTPFGITMRRGRQGYYSHFDIKLGEVKKHSILPFARVTSYLRLKEPSS